MTSTVRVKLGTWDFYIIRNLLIITMFVFRGLYDIFQPFYVITLHLFWRLRKISLRNRSLNKCRVLSSKCMSCTYVYSNRCTCISSLSWGSDLHSDNAFPSSNHSLILLSQTEIAHLSACLSCSRYTNPQCCYCKYCHMVFLGSCGAFKWRPSWISNSSHVDLW